MRVGESLVGDGNEVAHIDLIIGPRGSAAETAFANALTNNKDGFSTLLAVVAPNLMVKPATILFNKVTIKGSKQAVQMFGPAQRGVAMAVADSVEDGTIPADEADDLFVSVGVFITGWLKTMQKSKVQHKATKAIARAVAVLRLKSLLVKKLNTHLQLAKFVFSYNWLDKIPGLPGVFLPKVSGSGVPMAPACKAVATRRRAGPWL